MAALGEVIPIRQLARPGPDAAGLQFIQKCALHSSWFGFAAFLTGHHDDTFVAKFHQSAGNVPMRVFLLQAGTGWLANHSKTSRYNANTIHASMAALPTIRA